MSETETSLDTMAEIRVLSGYPELLRFCKAYNSSWNRNGGRTAKTRPAESRLLERAARFSAEHGIEESDVLWTVGWDSAE